MGLGDSKLWRVTSINKDYAVCPTYPEELAVPASIGDEVLQVAAAQRSHMVHYIIHLLLCMTEFA